MFKHLSATGLLGLALTRTTFASDDSLKLSTEYLGGDSVAGFGVASTDALENLASISNMAFGDLPEFPQFTNLRKYEGLQYSANDILEDLVKEQDLELDAVRNHERFSQIEQILKEIAEELSNEDKKNECNDENEDEDCPTNDDENYKWDDEGKFDWDDKKFFDDDYYENDDEEDEEEEEDKCDVGEKEEEEECQNDNDYVTIKEPENEETFSGTEISVGKTQECFSSEFIPTSSIPLEPTSGVSVNSSVYPTISSVSSVKSSSNIPTKTSTHYSSAPVSSYVNISSVSAFPSKPTSIAPTSSSSYKSSKATSIVPISSSRYMSSKPVKSIPTSSSPSSINTLSEQSSVVSSSAGTSAASSTSSEQTSRISSSQPTSITSVSSEQSVSTAQPTSSLRESSITQSTTLPFTSTGSSTLEVVHTSRPAPESTETRTISITSTLSSSSTTTLLETTNLIPETPRIINPESQTTTESTLVPTEGQSSSTTISPSSSTSISSSKTSGTGLRPSVLAQNNASNATVGGAGFENSSGYQAPATFLLAAIFSALLLMQV